MSLQNVWFCNVAFNHVNAVPSSDCNLYIFVCPGAGGRHIESMFTGPRVHSHPNSPENLLIHFLGLKILEFDC